MLDCNEKGAHMLSVILKTWEDLIFVLLVVVLCVCNLELLLGLVFFK